MTSTTGDIGQTDVTEAVFAALLICRLLPPQRWAKVAANAFNAGFRLMVHCACLLRWDPGIGDQIETLHRACLMLSNSATMTAIESSFCGRSGPTFRVVRNLFWGPLRRNLWRGHDTDRGGRVMVPGSNTARFLIFTGVVVALATAVIATKGQLGRRSIDAAR